MAIREELELDLSSAAGSIGEIDSLLSTTAQSFGVSLSAALEVLGGAQLVELTADASAMPAEIDAAVAAANGQVPVDADTTGMSAEIDAATAGTSAEITVTADTSPAEASLSGLGDTAGGAAGGLDALGESGSSAGNGLASAAQNANIVSGASDVMNSRTLGAGGGLRALGGTASTVAPQLAGAATGMAGIGAASAGAAGPLAAAGTAFAASVAVGVGLTSIYTGLADKVRSFSTLTGTSAEKASLWVGAASAMGIESSRLNTGFAIAARNIGTNSEKLEAHGVAIARNADGTVNLTGTILSAGEAWRRTTDSTEKARIGQDLFGRSWRELTPLLARSGEEIEALGRKTGLMFSQADLDRAKQFSLDLNTLKTQATVTAAELGEKLLPVVGRVLEFFGDLASGAGNVGQALLNILGPGLAVVAGGLGGLGNFFASNQLAANALAVVIAARLVPALVTMGYEAGVAIAKFVAGQWAQAVAGVQALARFLALGGVSAVAFGVGLAGAALVIAQIVSETKKHQDANRKWADDFIAGTLQSGDAAGALRAKIAELDGELAKNNAHFMSGTPFEVSSKNYHDTLEKVNHLKEGMKELERGHSSLGAVQLAGAAGVAGFTGSLGDEARAADALAIKLGVTSDLIAQIAAKRGVDLSQGIAAAEEQLAGFVRDLSFATSGQLEFSNAWEVLGDATANATEKTQAYKTALDALNGAQIGSESTLNQLTIGIGKLSDLAPEASRSLNQLDVAGATNRQTLVGLAQNVSDAASAHQRLTGDVGGANAMLVAQRQRLIDAAVAAGFDRDAVTLLITSLTGIVAPPPVTPLVDPVPAEAKIGQLKTSLGGWHNYASTTNPPLNANNAPGIGAVDGLNSRFGAWENRAVTANPALNANNAPAVGSVDGLNARFGEWENHANTANPNLNANPEPGKASVADLHNKSSETNSFIDSLYPSFKVDPGQALGALQSIINKAADALSAVASVGGSWNPLNRMAGGPVNAGQAYIVGERHAELFVPDRSGTIVPRVPPMARGEPIGSEGGGGTTVHFAIDARGSTMTEAQFRRVAREEIAPAVEQVVAKVRSGPR